MQTIEQDGHLITVFGDWTEGGKVTLDASGELLIRWLSGETLVDPAAALDIIRNEFVAQERYRNTITTALADLQREFMSRAMALKADGRIPATSETKISDSPGAVYHYGHIDGEYEGYMKCAQRIQDIIDKAALEVSKK